MSPDQGGELSHDARGDVPRLREQTHTVIILNTISKRQDGLGFIGKNGYIFHDSSRCIEVLIGGAYAHMFEDLLQVISYNIPLFSLIQMLKFVLHILNLK